jgi:hypothetical protein
LWNVTKNEVPIMRPVLRAIVAATLLTVSVTTVALADKPANTCGAAPSGFFLADRERWWSETVAGFIVAGITVYEGDGVTFTDEFEELALAMGFADAAAMKDWILGEQWAALDHNQNGWLCMRLLPITPGNPGYFFAAADDQASSPWGGTN